MFVHPPTKRCTATLWLRTGSFSLPKQLLKNILRLHFNSSIKDNAVGCSPWSSFFAFCYEANPHFSKPATAKVHVVVCRQFYGTQKNTKKQRHPRFRARPSIHSHINVFPSRRFEAEPLFCPSRRSEGSRSVEGCTTWPVTHLGPPTGLENRRLRWLSSERSIHWS